jgi:TolB protein
MSDQATVTSRTAPVSPLPFWKKALLLLLLIAFFAASYLFLQLGNSGTGSQLPPVLYLAEDVAGRLQLFLASDPAWQPNQLTNETAEILSYAPSPDGSQIVYAAAQADGSTTIQLFTLKNRIAGSPQTVLTCDNAECSQPVWHPDGRRLLYERRTPPGFSRPQLWWLNIATGETMLLLEKKTAVGSNARFSPDGSWISFAASPDEGIRLFNFDDGRSFTFISNVGTPAAWHPLGKQLLIQNSRTVVFHGKNNSNHREHSHDYATAVSLYLATLETQATNLLSSDGAFDDGNPAWSPDGEWIAFGRRLAQTNTGRQLWLMRADGSEARPLTNDIAIHFGPPSWSPDGRFLLFQQVNSSRPQTPPSIWMMAIDTDEFSQIVPDGFLPTWLPTQPQ